MHPLGLQCQRLPSSPGARPDPREAPGLLQACPGHPPPMWGETQALSRCPSASGRQLTRVWGSPVLPGSPARQNLQGAATESLERRRKHKVQDPKELLQRSNMTYSTSVLGHVFFGGVSFLVTGERATDFRPPLQACRNTPSVPRDSTGCSGYQQQKEAHGVNPCLMAACHELMYPQCGPRNRSALWHWIF